MDQQRKSSIPRLAGFFLSCLAAWIANPSYADVVNATGQSLQSSARVNRVEIDYTYTLTVHNTGAAVKNVAGTLTSSSPNTVVMDGAVVIANIGADTTTTGTDTFTIRQNRSYPFNPADLRWSFTFELDTPANHPPTANAGTNQTVFVGDSVTLDGSASSDVDGNALSFSWSLVSVPAGSTATLSSASSVNPTFVTDKPGNYVAQLIVNDGTVDSAVSTVTISTQNSPPVAQAGPDQSVVLGSTVQLSGVGSSDVDGNLLNFMWSFVNRPAGSTASLSSVAAVNPTFVADVPGTYVAQLIVNDGAVNSLTDTVTITTDNTAPVANAGVDQSVVLNGTAQLEGAGSSDPEGAPLSYSWSFISRPSGSAALLSATNIVNPIFVADLPGTYVVQLIVSDGSLTSVADTVVVTTLNTVPVANAGPDQNVTTGATVVLDGRASSDADGNALFHVWSFTSVPGSVPTLTNPASPNPSFIANTDGNYVVQLTVNDGTVNSPPDTVMITATPAPNTVPIANPDAYSMSEDGTLLGTSVLANDTDADGNALTAQLVANVTTGALTFNANGTFTYIPPANFNGTVTFSYRANDGPDNSNTAVVTIQVAAVNDAPTANAGADHAGNEGVAVTLNAAGSSDPENSTLTFQWSLVSTPPGSTATLTNPTTASPSFTPNVGGAYVVQLIVNDGALNSTPDTVTITVTAAVPVISVVAQDANAAETGSDVGVFRFSRTGNTAAPLTLSFTINGTATNGTDYQTIPGFVTFASGQSAVDVTVTPIADTTVEGAETVLLTLVDGASYDLGAQASATVTIADSVVVTYTLGGTLSGLTGTVVLQNNGGNDLALSTNGSFTFTTALTNNSAYIVTVLTPPAAQTCAVTNGSGTVNGANVTNVSVNCVTTLPPDPSLPPDPITVAPPIDRTVASDIHATTAFLYTGTNPIQTGVAPGTLELKRVAVLRGKVAGRDGSALTAVKISVLGHPEFGQTLTRADGMFDLAVNGGGLLTVDYQKPGFLPVQRPVNVPWQDFVVLPDVVMIPLDSAVTTIAMNAAAMQVARGNATNDADGTRRATLLIPQGTTANLVLPNGTTQPVTSLNVRATEYTVGTNGPQAMPGELPPTSAYTYAVELSADEAITAGATEVSFSSPLPFYVENFLGFPVGTAVPLGSYDRTRGVWVPAESGRVIKLLSVANGRAELDLDGDGLTDGSSALAALAVTDAERQQLATLYAPGQSLWRVRIPHFTPYDLNWPYAPEGATAPVEDPEIDEPQDCQSEAVGSIIGCQNQTLGEALGVTGTPFGLHYQSERTPGRKDAYRIEIPLSGASLPPEVRGVQLEIRIAGRLFRQSFPAEPDQRTEFAWDGTDVYGRMLQGSQPVTVRIGYSYVLGYGGESEILTGRRAVFGNTADMTISGSGGRQAVTLWRTWQGQIGAWDARAVGLGGWTLSAHHTYDPAEQVVYHGDGQRQSAQFIGAIVSTVAGTGQSFTFPDGGDGIPATQANIAPAGIAVGPDGSLYFPSVGRIRKVTPKGIITTVAGKGIACFSGPCGDGGPATEAGFSSPTAMAIGPDESLYISDVGNYKIRKVKNGIITTVAGTGTTGFSGDGGPARLAQISQVFAIAVGPDGSLYLADLGNNRIRRVGLDGIITTVAGVGFSTSSGDGTPATRAGLNYPYGMAVGRDGSLYIAENGGRVRRVTPDGIIRTIAGNGMHGFAGDGGPATQASFRNPTAVAVGADDTVYIVDRGNNRVRWLRPGGVINTLAGTGVSGTSGDGAPALAATFQSLDHGVAVGPDGAVYVTQHTNNPRIRRISPLGEGVASAGGIAIPAGDGSEVYLFTSSGRHLKTLDGLTGALRYQFAYDSAGRSATITDGDGNVTTIERDTAGAPTAIRGPFGQRTTLAMNPNGYLSRVTNPAGEAVQLDYTADGLLTGFTSPGGHSSSYAYDTQGRLTSATDPTGASKTLARTGGASKDYTITLTSAGRATTHRVERLATGGTRLTTTDPAGLQTRVVIGLDGRQTATYPDGTVVISVFGPDPRWRMLAPFATSQTVMTTGGNVQMTTVQRTATLATPGDVLNLRAFGETTTTNGRAFTIAYDAVSRTVTQTSPAGRRSTAVIDEWGRLIQEQLGDLAPTSYTYDLRGRLATAIQGTGPSARSASSAYGTDGFLASVADSTGRTVAFTKDAAGRVSDLALADGRQIRFAYDANGNVSGRTPSGRPEHTFGYTARDQLATYTAPAVGTESNQTHYSYGADRQPAQVQRPDGQAVGFGYDAAARLSQLGLVSGNLTFAYDAAGRLSALGAPAIALAYTYNDGLPTGTTWSGAVAGSVTWTYDSDFRVTALGVNGAAVTFQYDADGLPVRVGDLVLTRAAQSGLITGTTLGASADAVSYDGFGEPTRYTANHAGSTVYAEQHTRDLLGRLTSKTETLGGATRTVTYAYDPAGRLSEVHVDGAFAARYTYDANGNRLSRTGAVGTATATYDAQDRLAQYGATTYAYTPNGEISGKSTGGQTTAYRYDGLGNLTGATLPAGTEIAYLLDGLGRRAGKRVDGALVLGFLYQDGLRPIAELDGSGAVVSRFVYATGGNVPDYLVKAGVTYRIVTDHLGSPRLVIDSATGQVAQRLDYDEWGRVLLDTNPGFQPFGFAGGLYDRDTGLVHFGARDYDPETGRWTTKDPIGFAGGDANLYAYVGNDPVNHVDPSGLMTTLKGCFVTPVNAAACAEAGIIAGAGVARYGQQAAQAIQRGGAAAANAVCRIPTLQGLGNLGPAGPVDVGKAGTLPSIAQQANMAVQSLAPRVAQLAGNTPSGSFWQNWMNASRNWRMDSLSQKQAQEVVMWISRWADSLLGPEGL